MLEAKACVLNVCDPLFVEIERTFPGRISYIPSMKISLRFLAGLGWAIMFLLGVNGNASAHSMNCDAKLPRTHAQLAQNDQNSPNHLELSREIGGGAAIDLDVCTADLTVLGGIGDKLRVTVDLGNLEDKLTAGDYLETLDASPRNARVELHLPPEVKARVVIVLPAGTSKLDLNLVRGSLRFEAARISGQREVNLVSGHLDFLGNADSYEHLDANVVMGSFHDYRQNGSGHGVLVSRSQSGTGKGSIDLNVVKGSLDLKPWD